MQKEITFEVDELTVLETRSSGWNLEFNLVSWNGEPPKYDIRPWNGDHTRCGKGIALNEEAVKKLVTYCNDNQIMDI